MTVAKATNGLQQEHQKEERFLSPLLEARGIPASGCPITVLHNEHEKGRGLLAQLDDATQAFLTSGSAKDVLVMTLRPLVRLYVDHIWKEYYLLLPRSDKVLSENDHAKCASSLISSRLNLARASIGNRNSRRDWSTPVVKERTK